MAHEKWASQQISEAVALGVNVLDAQTAVRALLATLPFGVEPDTYIVPANRLEQELTSGRVLDDARAAFYSKESVPPQFKRLLDAGTE